MITYNIIIDMLEGKETNLEEQKTSTQQLVLQTQMEEKHGANKFDDNDLYSKVLKLIKGTFFP